MANWNASFVAATSSITAQIGTLDTTTTPTLADATAEWERLGPFVSVKARSAGLSGTVADWSNDGLEYFRLAEARLICCWVLRMKATGLGIYAPTGGDVTGGMGAAEVLCEQGSAMLERETLRREARGLVAYTGAYAAADSRIGSDWTRNADPDFTNTPGDDRGYARGPHRREGTFPADADQN